MSRPLANDDAGSFAFSAYNLISQYDEFFACVACRYLPGNNYAASRCLIAINNIKTFQKGFPAEKGKHYKLENRLKIGN
jgi:hypothetical protein